MLAYSSEIPLYTELHSCLRMLEFKHPVCKLKGTQSYTSAKAASRYQSISKWTTEMLGSL